MRGAEEHDVPPQGHRLHDSMAIVPDAVFYMTVTLTTLVLRTFEAHAELDYWESGMDCGLSRDWSQSFVRCQRRIRRDSL